MTTPTNWPNPERPGYPMFPERDGWHNFVGHHLPCAEEDDTDSPKLSPTYLYCCWWDSEGQAWSGFDEAPWDLEECADSLADMEYHGPVLTPTQLTELLAGKYSIPVIQTALRVWDALDECDRTDADDMTSLEQNGLMTRGIVEDANEFEDLEVGEPVWHFNAAGHALVSAIRNLGDAP